jgi:pyridoxal phosphate enzyme (YggS family)
MRRVAEAADDTRSRIAAARATIAAAARRAGRDPAAVRIIAVTKTMPPAAVLSALSAGLEDIGENYVQEAARKREAVAGPATWHLIGGLQRNKATAAVRTFDWVHSVDSPRLGQALADAAESAGRRLPVLIQVNLSGVAGQRGTGQETVEPLAEALVALPSLALQGLMTIAPAGGATDEIRSHFRRVRLLRDAVAKRLGVELPQLSMGMSDDFSLAVEEGATLVRLGRALFGPRGSRSWWEGA